MESTKRKGPRWCLGTELLRGHLGDSRKAAGDFSRTTGISRQLLSLYLYGDRVPGLRNALIIEASTGQAVPMSSWTPPIDTPAPGDAT